jgi:ubiquinone/menaquinone biosynthesis C-methylase UbiE
MTFNLVRLNREKKFHNEWASNLHLEKINLELAFEGSTAPENRFIMSHLGDVRGKYLLDLGCGAGESSVYFTLKGARCVATDWSPRMVSAARRLAQMHQVEIEISVLNASDIDYPDNTFDIVYAANLLHHVETDLALQEIHRVLKPGGVACLWDPLKYNPLINLYRRIAVKVRTEDEKPLGFSILDTIRNLFAEFEYDTFWLATLWIFLRFYLIERVDPNEERYWKKILTEEPRLRSSYLQLEKIDHLIKKIPYLKIFAWNIAIVAKK